MWMRSASEYPISTSPPLGIYQRLAHVAREAGGLGVDWQVTGSESASDISRSWRQFVHRFSDLDTGCQTNNRLRTAERKKKTFLKNLLGLKITTTPPPTNTYPLHALWSHITWHQPTSHGGLKQDSKRLSSRPALHNGLHGSAQNSTEASSRKHGNRINLFIKF